MANGTGWQETFLNAKGEREDGSEDGEKEFFRKIAEEIQEEVKHFAATNSRPLRGNHAKILAGIIGAEFRIAPDLPADLAVGFLKPNNVYAVDVRFSNASGERKEDDTEDDLRGVAIRVKTELGEHDFLMTNAEPHHAKDVREAMATIMAATQEGLLPDVEWLDKPDSGFLAGLEDRLRELSNKSAALRYLVGRVGPSTALHIVTTLKSQMHRPVESLATETYWSRAPIAIGAVPDPARSVAVKYRLKPVVDKSEHPERQQDLGKEFKTRLNQGAVQFLFQVQRYIEPEITPIEDATVAWKSDYRTIAILTIPHNANLDDSLIDGLTFNPWHVDQKTFRPLGSMNRARRMVYEASASLRERPRLTDTAG